MKILYLLLGLLFFGVNAYANSYDFSFNYNQNISVYESRWEDGILINISPKTNYNTIKHTNLSKIKIECTQDKKIFYIWLDQKFIEPSLANTFSQKVLDKKQDAFMGEVFDIDIRYRIDREGTKHVGWDDANVYLNSDQELIIMFKSYDDIVNKFHGRHKFLLEANSKNGKYHHSLAFDISGLDELLYSIPICRPVNVTEKTQHTNNTAKEAVNDSQLIGEVQQLLKELGYYTGAIDEKYGPQTARAIKRFQLANNLQSDGKISQKLKTALEQEVLLQTKYFTRGSHQSEVLRLEGTPRSIETRLDEEIWYFSGGYVTIKNKHVVSWTQLREGLSVRMRPGSNITDKEYFTRGSHQDEVLRLQGTPIAFDVNSYSNEETWFFSGGYVIIKRVKTS